MIWFAARTILGGLVALLVAALIVFLCLDLGPGEQPHAIDLAQTAAGFLGWVFGALRGDMGVSAAEAAPVGVLIGGRLALTLPLIALGAVVAALFGAAIGYGATRRGRMIDLALTGLSELLSAIANFWLGMLLVILFAVTLHWLPAGGFVAWTTSPAASLASLLLPALALGLPLGATLAVQVRNEIVRALAAPRIRAARARGMTVADAFRAHGARSVVLALLAAAGPIGLSLAVGSVVIEAVFYLPGLGRLLLDAIAARDVLVVRSAILILLAIAVVLSVLLRLAMGWVDPRLSQPAAA